MNYNEVWSKYSDMEAISSLKEVETIPQLMEILDSYGDRVAIVDKEEYTFKALLKRAGEIRNTLKKNGVSAGDKVGVLFPNSFELIGAVLGIMSYGAVAVLLPFQLDDKAIFGCSMKFSMTVFLCGAASEGKVAFMKGNNPTIKVLYAEDIKDGYAEMGNVSPKDGGAIVFTSGTTGQSKGALLSHKALTIGMRNGLYGYEGVLNQKYFLVLPLTHIFGLIRNLLTSLYTGSSLYVCRDMKEMFREMSVYKPTIIVMVPALAEVGLNMTKMLSPSILGGELKTIICGAATVYPYLAKEYEKIGVTLLAGYGLTETANLVSGNPKTLENPESVGLLYPNQEYKIVDGELWVKGDNLFDCYYGDEEATKNSFEDGYFKTGDLVRIDEDGFLYITGRCKEVIVLGTGENISPSELETKFCEIDCIQDALIYVEKEGNAEKLVLEVLPRMAVIKQKGIEDAKAYCLEKIKQVNDGLYDYQKINKIIVRERDFERTPSMKIKRPGMM